ncbi:MAG: biotin/lipoyl-binding protein [Deltaproteobacteria bacterium]|nr:biotin/lipoyl-binding protein [Deltaproteobacteria bacterium]
MRSSFLAGNPKLRRILPWALWGLAAAIAIPLGWSYAGVGASPAVVQARVSALAPMRTDHRLRVKEILVKPGQSVKQGELLMQFDTGEVDADLAVVRATLVYEELMARWQETKMRESHARTTHAFAANAERAAVDAARLKAEAERDRSELAQLEVNLALEEKLVGDQLADSKQLNEMRQRKAALTKKVQEYQIAVNQARRSAAGSSRRLSDLRKGIKGQSPVVAEGTVEEISAQFAAGEIHRAEIKRLELLRTFHEIRAPFDGRVGDIFLQVGQLCADPTLPAMTVVEEPAKTAVAYAQEASADQVRLGDVATLVPRDLSGATLTGRVVALAPSVTEMPVRFWKLPSTPAFGRNVYIELDRPGGLSGQAYNAVFDRGSGGGR